MSRKLRTGDIVVCVNAFGTGQSSKWPELIVRKRYTVAETGFCDLGIGDYVVVKEHPEAQYFLKRFILCNDSLDPFDRLDEMPLVNS